MKVILSRKGFDSKYGRMASPILPDGRLLPLPIPSNHDKATFADLSYMNVDMGKIISDLSGGKHSLATHIHLDPDIDCANSAHLPGWRPSLGQTGIPQSHLSNMAIGSGDVFLFFGWFRQTEQVDGRWRYARGAPDLHVIFGWLEVADGLPIVTQRDDALTCYPWIASHPHVASPLWYTDNRNTLYIASSRSAYTSNDSIGGGRFPMMHTALQLTKPGRSRSIWSLPAWFSPQGRPPLSHHPNSSSWHEEDGTVTLHSAAIGQEFVIDGDIYSQLESWAGNLIRAHS